MAAATAESSKRDDLVGPAQRVGELFCQLKQERASPTKRRPLRRNRYEDEKSRRQFYEVARMCQQQGWDIELYVRAAFDTIRKNHNYVDPKDLLRPQVSGAYAVQEVSRSLDIDPRVRLEQQIRELLIFLKLPAGLCTEHAVLFSPLTPFDPWFRVLYPEQPDETILDIYGEAARQELAQDKLLRRFARTRFPRGVAELERRFGSFGDNLEVAK